MSDHVFKVGDVVEAKGDALEGSIGVIIKIIPKGKGTPKPFAEVNWIVCTNWPQARRYRADNHPHCDSHMEFKEFKLVTHAEDITETSDVPPSQNPPPASASSPASGKRTSSARGSRSRP